MVGLFPLQCANYHFNSEVSTLKFLLVIYLSILIMILNINSIILRFCNFYASEFLVFICLYNSFLSLLCFYCELVFFISAIWVNTFLMYVNHFREAQCYSWNFLEIFQLRMIFETFNWILRSLFNLWMLFSCLGEKHSELIGSEFSFSWFKTRSFFFMFVTRYSYINTRAAFVFKIS